MQLIDKQTKVTDTLHSLLDVIMVSDPALTIRKVTISDHFLDFTDINLKSPKQAPTYVATRSFCNYKADQFATDITHIPSDTVNLRDPVDDRLDAFNELFLACLENHAPLRTVKI